MVKSRTRSPSEVIFFSCWSNLIQSRRHVMEKALLLRFFFKVSFDQLFDNLECGKIYYCFGKSLKFCIKNLYEP